MKKSDLGNSRWKFRSLVSYASVASLLLVFGFASCSKRYQDLPVFSAIPFRDAENQSVGRFKTSYLADQIHAYFRGSLNGTIAVTTFVDIDNLYESSTFGRILGEQLMSELAMLGYNVVELRQAEALQVMFDKGEFGLSRDTEILKKNQNISAIVVGTYAVSPVRVYLNTRMIDPTSSLITSVGSVEMQKTSEITRLLRTNNLPPALERIPVRHLGYTTSPAPRFYPYYSMPYWSPSAPSAVADEQIPWLHPGTPELPKAEGEKPSAATVPAPALEPTS